MKPLIMTDIMSDCRRCHRCLRRRMTRHLNRVYLRLYVHYWPDFARNPCARDCFGHRFPCHFCGKPRLYCFFGDSRCLGHFQSSTLFDHLWSAVCVRDLCATLSGNWIEICYESDVCAYEPIDVVNETCSSSDVEVALVLYSIDQSY